MMIIVMMIILMMMMIIVMMITIRIALMIMIGYVNIISMHLYYESEAVAVAVDRSSTSSCMNRMRISYR